MKHKIIILIYIIISLNKSFAQSDGINKSVLNNSQYEVINDLFDTEKSHTVLYHKTDISKTWSFLMTPERLDMLLGPPCNNGSKRLEWKDIFKKNDFKILHNEIIQLKSLQLDKAKLNKGIKVSDSCEKRDDKHITVISAPIIIGKYAIVKQSSWYGESILIANKDKNKWSVICRKSVFQILE